MEHRIIDSWMIEYEHGLKDILANRELSLTSSCVVTLVRSPHSCIFLWFLLVGREQLV